MNRNRTELFHSHAAPVVLLGGKHLILTLKEVAVALTAYRAHIVSFSNKTAMPHKGIRSV